MPAAITAIVIATRSLPFIDRLLGSKTGYQDFTFECRSQIRVAAPVKNQWRCARCPVQRNHLPHDNPVVSAVMNRVCRTAEGCRATVEPRTAIPVEKRERRRQRIGPPPGEIG